MTDKKIQPDQKEDRAIALMQAVIPLMEDKWPDPNKILKICDDFTNASDLDEFDALEMKILFLTGLLNEVIKQIPHRLFPDIETRENLIETTQELINGLVKQEEEMLDFDEDEDEGE